MNLMNKPFPDPGHHKHHLGPPVIPPRHRPESTDPRYQGMNEIDMDRVPVPSDFQDQYDQYIRNVSVILNNPDIEVDEFTESTLRLGISILEYYRHSIQELEFYQHKYTKIPPLDMEMSEIKKCHIGKCRCGQLLIEYKDKCCPRCSQFIDWTDPLH